MCNMYVCVCMYIYIYIHMLICIICIYIERERYVFHEELACLDASPGGRAASRALLTM